MSPLEALEKAVVVVGGQTSLAEMCGGKTRQQHVFNWLNRDKKLPERHAIKVQRATAALGDAVYAWQLRPDVFSKDDIAA